MDNKKLKPKLSDFKLQPAPNPYTAALHKKVRQIFGCAYVFFEGPAHRPLPHVVIKNRSV